MAERMSGLFLHRCVITKECLQTALLFGPPFTRSLVAFPRLPLVSSLLLFFLFTAHERTSEGHAFTKDTMPLQSAKQHTDPKIELVVRISLSALPFMWLSLLTRTSPTSDKTVALFWASVWWIFHLKCQSVKLARGFRHFCLLCVIAIGIIKKCQNPKRAKTHGVVYFRFEDHGR